MTSGITLNAPSWAIIRLISATILLLDWVHRKIIHSLWKSLSGIVFFASLCCVVCECADGVYKYIRNVLHRSAWSVRIWFGCERLRYLQCFI